MIGCVFVCEIENQRLLFVFLKIKNLFGKKKKKLSYQFDLVGFLPLMPLQSGSDLTCGGMLGGGAWVCSGMDLINFSVGSYWRRYGCLELCVSLIGLDGGRFGGNHEHCRWFCHHGFMGFG